MKLPKFNQRGITHILAPILFIGIFATIGSLVLLRSNAQTPPPTYTNGKLYSGNFTVNPVGNGTGLKELDVPTQSREKSNMSLSGTKLAYWKVNSISFLRVIFKGTINYSTSTVTNRIAIAKLPSNTDPNKALVLSPDGTKVAGTITTPHGQKIVVANTDGSDVNSDNLYVPNVQKSIGSYIGWLPGSQKIVYVPSSYTVSGSTICTISTSGANRNCNPIDTSHISLDGIGGLGLVGLAVSPSGGKVALVAVNSRSHQIVSSNIYTVEPDGHYLKLRKELPAGQQVKAAVWSPDGTKIAYVLSDVGYSAPQASGLYLMNADGSGTPTKLDIPTVDFFTDSLSWAHQ